MNRKAQLVRLAVCLVAVGGWSCTPAASSPPTAASNHVSSRQPSAPASAAQVRDVRALPAFSSTTAFSAVAVKGADDRERLERLWQERTHATGTSDFVLGPGDVVEISVPVVPELKDRTERVAGNGTISLPFVGTIAAAGLTERQLKEELAQKLSAIMYKPQVDLFVKEYKSRQVAVVGQVDKPGLYDLSSSSDTLLDMLNAAGGVNKFAAQRVLFIPAHEQLGDASGHTMNVAMLQSESTQDLLRQRHPIEIGLGDLDRGGDPAALMLPARPGDMLVVPGAGEVVVEGWVDKPGSYPITPNLTLAGAIGAAGGTMFASKNSAVSIMRDGADGKKVFITADLDKIQAGQEADIPVQEGDVVSVPYSALKLLPYGAISLIGRGIYFSAAAPAF